MTDKEIYKELHKKRYSREELILIANKVSRKTSFLQKNITIFETKSEKNQGVLNIIYPIYNEGSNIPTLFDSLKHSCHFNKSINLIFILNGCTDNSKQSIHTEIKLIKSSKKISFNIFQLGDTKISILESKDKSKVKAIKKALKYLNVGKEDYVLTLDADFILEPTTLAEFSKEIDNSDTEILVGTAMMTTKKGTLFTFKGKYHYAWDFSSYKSIPGCCVAMNANWLTSELDEVLLEDYLLGLKARKDNITIKQVPNARLWGFRNNIFDEFRQLKRSIIGRFQIIERYPNLKSIVYSDVFFINSCKVRLVTLYKKIKNKPLNCFSYILQFLFVEYCLFIGKKEYKRNPSVKNWNKLESSNL